MYNDWQDNDQQPYASWGCNKAQTYGWHTTKPSYPTGNYQHGLMADDEVTVKKRKLVQIDSQGNRLGHTYKGSPYGAGQKAAMNGYTDIYLYDPEVNKVYSYDGRIEDTPVTPFTVKYGQTKRGVVKSRGYIDLNKY